VGVNFLAEKRDFYDVLGGTVAAITFSK